MQWPFELSSEDLHERLEEMVQITISDLVSDIEQVTFRFFSF